jgi:hypothetical protein
LNKGTTITSAFITTATTTNTSLSTITASTSITATTQGCYNSIAFTQRKRIVD